MDAPSITPRKGRSRSAGSSAEIVLIKVEPSLLIRMVVSKKERRIWKTRLISLLFQSND